MDPAILLFVGPAIAFVALFSLGPLALRPMLNRIIHGSPEKQARGKQLMATGEKARAMVTSIQPTGTVVNRVHIQCVLGFRIEPLDGSPEFAGQKTAYISQTQLPRQGDVWPCWFDADDRSSFVVGVPDLADPETQATLRTFGIANPLDVHS